MENSATDRLFLPSLYKFTKEKKTDLHDKINQLLAIQDMMTEDKNKLSGEIELLEMYTNCLNVFRSSLAENLLFSSH